MTTVATYGLCECGCGRKTNLAKQNHTKFGYRRGEPIRFIQGHRAFALHVPVADRFWCKVRKSDGCWEWTGSIGSHGYGQIMDRGTPLTVHRVSYLLAHGEDSIADGLYVMHRCDNKKCVNPDHLSLGTHADNMADMTSKGRHWQQKKRETQVSA